jgi:hypothetical protein
MQILTLEQAILETARSLSLDKQQTLLDFAQFLAQKSPAKKQWSSDFLSTFGAWEGELVREPQGEQAEREPFL